MAPRNPGRPRRPAPATRPAARGGWRESPAALVASLLAVFGVSFLAHHRTLGFDFLTSWDDPTYVVQNPWIRGLTRENLVHAFTHPYFANYLPLHLVSYMVDYTFWGLRPFGFHLQSVLLDGINAALALLVVRRLFGSLPLALLAALLFAVHPSHVEAVAWVSIRKDLLSTAFLLLTVLFYLEAVEPRRLKAGWYAASCAAFLLGLFSKVSIAALPAFLLLLDLFPAPGRNRLTLRASLLTKIPYGLAALALVIVNSRVQVKAQAPYAHDAVRYLMVKGHAVWNYLALLTGIPRGRPVYDTPEFSLGAGTVLWNLAGIVVLPLVLAIGWFRRWRLVTLGTGWLFVLLVPAIAFPLVTYMADRYLYAPSLGFCWIVAAGIVVVAARAPAGGARIAVMAALVAIPLALWVERTTAYDDVWRNGRNLWTYASARSRDYRVQNNLAQEMLNENRLADAERYYRLASAAENPVSHQGLATVYYDQKRYPDAQREIEVALEIALRQGTDPENMADLQFTRGAIYWVQGQNQNAIEAWQAALRANPYHAGAQQWLQKARGG